MKAESTDMVNSTQLASFLSQLKERFTTLVLGIIVIQPTKILGALWTLMKIINIMVEKTELLLMESKRNSGAFVITPMLATFHQDVSSYCLVLAIEKRNVFELIL